jgi:ribosomal-protein-serine acetyltransferase
MMFRHPLDDATELRLLERHHARELFDLCDSNREHLRAFLPWIEHTHSASDVERFIESALRQFAGNDGFHAGIWHCSRLVGCCGMHPIDWNNRAVSLGYWIDRAHQGRGIATAACRALADHCVVALGLNRVEIRCASDNARSCAIARRLGFRHDGTLRQAQLVAGRWLDIEVYSLLKSDCT